MRLFICGILTMLIIGTAHAATDPAKSPDDIFKASGLIKTGASLVVPQETALHDAVTVLRTAKGKLAAAAQKIRDADFEIKSAQRNLQALEDELHDTNVRMAKGQNDNQLLGRHNLALDEIKSQLEKLDKLAADRQKLLASKSDYITAALDASERADAALHAYDAPHADKELAAAIDTYNLTAKPKVKLGPSAYFNEDLDLVKKCKVDVTSGTIPINLEGGVPNVEVLLNGKVTETFVWDSGATYVCLSAKTAADLGLHAKDSDPTVEMSIADGSHVKQHILVLDSIRIGAFTVENVPCIIAARGTQGSDLLGNVFQKHFQFKLDVNAATLQLTPLDAKIAAVKPAVPSEARPGKPFTARTVDLLALIDPKKPDAVKGSWKMDNGELIVSAGDRSQLNLEYMPPAEFDLCVEFTRDDRKYGNMIVFPHADQMVWWATDADSSGFGPLPKGKASSSVHVENGHRCKLRIEVRADRLREFLDDKLLVDHPTDFSDFLDAPDYLKQTPRLQLVDWWSAVRYHKIEIVERSGPGTWCLPDGSTREIPSRAIKSAPSPALPAGDPEKLKTIKTMERWAGVWNQSSSHQNFTLNSDGTAAATDGNTGVWTVNADGSAIDIKWTKYSYLEWNAEVHG